MATLDRNGNAIGEATNAIKAPCSAATTGANITLSGVQTIDGVSVGNNAERVLVKDQTTPSQNGIYVASTGAWLYATDYNSNSANSTGTQVYIAGGSVNGGQMFTNLCTDNPIVIGTSAVTFAAVSTYGQQAASSSTSATISTGSRTFTVQSGKAFAANQWVVIYQTANNANAMLGQIVSYSGTSLAVNVTATGGAGTYAAWTIVLTNSPAGAGITPPVGTGNVTGPGSSTAGHVATFADASGKVLLDGGPLAGGTSAALLAASAVSLGFNMLNGQISVAASAGALTISVLTIAGATPSAVDPVWFMFRSATATSGAMTVVEVTAALSVTIPAGSTLNFVTNTPGRVWIAAVNNAGTVSLTVMNALTITLSGGVPTAASVYPVGAWGIAYVTAFGGGANAPQIFYGVSALASVPYATIGYVSWEAPVTMTAGTWVAPTRVEVYRPGVPLPGQVVQTQYAVYTGSTTLTAANTQTGTTVTISLVSSANLVWVDARASVTESGAAAGSVTTRLSRGTGPTYFGNVSGFSTNSTSVSYSLPSANDGYDFPATLSATSYYVYGLAGVSGGAYNPFANASISAQEIMA